MCVQEIVYVIALHHGTHYYRTSGSKHVTVLTLYCILSVQFFISLFYFIFKYSKNFFHFSMSPTLHKSNASLHRIQNFETRSYIIEFGVFPIVFTFNFYLTFLRLLYKLVKFNNLLYRRRRVIGFHLLREGLYITDLNSLNSVTRFNWRDGLYARSA